MNILLIVFAIIFPILWFILVLIYLILINKKLKDILELKNKKDDD